MQKKSKLIFILVLLALFVGGSVVVSTFSKTKGMGKGIYYCPMHPTYTSDRPGDCPICNMRLVKKGSEGKTQSASAKETVCVLHNCRMTGCPMEMVAKPGTKARCPVCGDVIVGPKGEWTKEKKILYWTDPMIPGFKSNKPGESPMGMEMVAVYEEDKTLQEGTPGEATFFVSPEKQQLIGVKTSRVQKKEMTKTLRTVGKVAYDPDLVVAQEEYLQGLRTLERTKHAPIPEAYERAKALVEASRRRLLRLGMSEDQIEELAKNNASQTNLFLPGKGESVWVYATLYEQDLSLVTAGMSAKIEAISYPGDTFTGTVRSVDPVLDPATRSVRARLEVQNPEGKLKPEMFVDVTFQISLGERLVIPEQAVLDTGARKVAFVVHPGGHFVAREISVGQRSESSVEILKGLSEGEEVVTSSTFLIDSESRLKAALEGMEGGGHQHGE